jgi:hypothetical protein
MKYRILNNFIIGFILVMFLTLSGCMTYKRAAEKFGWKSDTITKVVYRDTTIKVVIHGTDTVFATAYIQDTLYFQSGTAHSIVYVKHDTITQQLWSTDTTLIVKLDSVIKEKTILNKQVTTYKESAKIDKVLKWIFGCLAIVFLIVAIPRFFKKK